MKEHSEDNNCPSLAAEQVELDISKVSDRQEAFWLRHTKEPFEADRKDGIFALFAFVLGFFEPK